MQQQNVLAEVSQAELDAAARKKGYESHAHMMQMVRQGRRAPQDNAMHNRGQAEPNFLQQLFSDPRKALADAFSWHPANTIDHSARKLKEAREGARQ